jgi:hypothetical protein
MPLIAGAHILIAVAVIYHALRTGRPYYWFFIVMAFPVLGAVIYLLVEVLPGSRQERQIARIGHDLVKAVAPDRELKRRAEELAVNASIENKLKLAEECAGRGMFDEAIQLYESAREGQYRFEPVLLYGLARARFFNGQHKAARDLLAELREHAPSYYADEVALLSARAAAKLGDRTTALSEIERLLGRFAGLEARYRYAEILFEDGQTGEARRQLERVVEHAKRFRVRPDERTWARLAREGLAAMQAPA